MPVSADGIIFADTPDLIRDGVSWSKTADAAKAKPKPRTIQCIGGSPTVGATWRRCPNAATCCARLYVPSHAMSINAGAKDVSALMGAAFCDACFKKLKPEQFLRTEVKERIAMEFRRTRNATPNFAKAVIGRIPLYDPDFARYETMRANVERARR